MKPSEALERGQALIQVYIIVQYMYIYAKLQIKKAEV